MVSLKLKHLPVILVVVLIVGFSVAFLVSNIISKRINSIWLEDYEHLAVKNVEHLIEGKKELLEVLISDIIYNEQVIELFKAQDREGLKAYLEPFYEKYKKCGIEVMHFINPDLKSFLRMHSPEKFGDDNSFRKLLRKVASTKQMVTVYEAGKTGLALRCVAPVMDNNEFIGLFEVGIFLEQFLKDFEGDNELVLLADEKGKLDQPKFVRLNENVKIAEEVDLKKFIEDEHYYILKGNYHYFTHHFKDVDGETLALLLSRNSIADVVNINRLSTIITAIVYVVIVAVLVIITIILLKGVIKQISIAREGISKFENGDLTVRFDVSASNEVGELVKSISQAVEKLRNAFVSVQNSFVSINQSISSYATLSEKLKEIIKKANQSVEQVVSVAENVSASVEETNSGVEEVAAAAQNVAYSAQQISLLTNSTFNEISNSMNVIKELVEKIQETIASSEKSLEVTSSLVNYSSQIQTIVDTINSIAEQTNLLALNAAIEAARAGEAGRGFAVVADEIRKLAEESKKSTADIQNILKNIKDGVEQVDQTVKQNAEVLNTSRESVEKAQEAFERIYKLAQDINSKAESLAAASQEQSASSEEISSAMQNATNSVNEIVQMMEELAEEMKNVEKTIPELEQADKQMEETILGFAEEFKKDFRVMKKEDYESVIDNAIVAHKAWLEKLREAVKSGKVVELQFNPHRCQFGTLYDFIAAPKGQEDKWAQIDKLHHDVHVDGKKSMDFVKERKLADAERLFKEVESTAQRLIGLLEDIKRNL